jgi:hypothetical protein
VQVFTWSSYFKVVGKVLKRKVVQNKVIPTGHANLKGVPRAKSLGTRLELWWGGGGSLWGHGASCPLGHPLSMAINNHWFSLVFNCQILKLFWFKKLDYTCTDEDPALRLNAKCINTMLSTCRNKSILYLSPWNKEFIIKTLPGILPPLESTYRWCWYSYSNQSRTCFSPRTRTRMTGQYLFQAYSIKGNKMS